eukprot:CAMPEP_0114523516 /NCGR_PEP_ID=MMETSP0109-20121206/21333_1 /TAXON_ID=29199 /ORGANISM="Chlorarachnion reptans, Strain CCCM449" /LENGTH=279 /DNA_ID=CAMNT_0001704837 /DNA_START=160 /DNA_END=999 /DNA_ORIENTATION=-
MVARNPTVRPICPALLPRSGRSVVANGENFFSRVGRVMRGYTNAIVEAFEDPEKLLDQAVVDMQSDLSKMRQANARVLASHKQLESKYKTAKATSDDWYKRAELAMRRGEESLARQALMRRKSFEEVSKGLEIQLDAQEKAMSSLLGNMRQLEGKIAEARSKKDTLKARAASAKTQKRVSEMIVGVDTSSALAAFEKMEAKVAALEAEGESSMIMAGGDSVDQAFRRLEAGNVDDELSELKKNCRSKMIEPPVRVRSIDTVTVKRIDLELDELKRMLSV